MAHWTDTYITVSIGPCRVARTCKVCGFTQVRTRGGGGRGAGFREGNRQHGVLVQHVKTCHPELTPGPKVPQEPCKKMLDNR